MTKTTWTTWLCSVSAFTVVMAAQLPHAHAHATLVAYDPFLSGNNRAAGEYTAGADIRTMGAYALGWVVGGDGFTTPHAGSTSNFQPNAIGDNVLAVTYETGGRLSWLGAGTSFNRNITRQLAPIPDSTEWWFSIITNRLAWTAANNSYAVGGFTDTSGNGLQVGYDNSNGDTSPDLVLRVGGTNVVLETDTPSSAARYVLVKLTINQSGNDTVNVWINPTSLTTSTPSDLTLTNFNVSNSLKPFTQSKYESPGSSNVTYWDEIRLATTFYDATLIPEPTTFGLLALASGLIVLRRRQA